MNPGFEDRQIDVQIPEVFEDFYLSNIQVLYVHETSLPKGII